jgi:GT2 family glycosyltransferase
MVSAVVLGYNRCGEVLITIEKLKQYAASLPFLLEIIVVDNASVDNTSAEVKRQHPDVKLIIKEKNNGIAGWNDGLLAATQKYILVLDDDSHPEYGIDKAVAYLENNEDTGILALNITSGPYLTDTWPWKNGKPWQDNEEILGFFGCGAIIRKTVVDAIGGFSEWIGVYGHEWDYGIRCIDAGYKIKYFRDSSIAHRASPVNRSKKRARIYGARNDMSIVYTYFGNKRWSYIWTMFFNNIKRAKSGDFVSAIYDMQGFFMFLKMKRSLAKKPVSESTRIFFADNYMNTHPVFGFVNKWFGKSSRSINNLN